MTCGPGERKGASTPAWVSLCQAAASDDALLDVFNWATAGIGHLLDQRSLWQGRVCQS